MKKLLLSFTALAALTATASAADLPARRAAPGPIIAAVPLFTWTGFYVGANAGYGWGDSDLTVTSNTDGLFPDDFDVAAFGRSSNEGSFTGGGQIGYNYQFGAAVIGAEADFNYINLNDHYVTRFTDGGISGTLEAGHKVQWFGTLRARLGFTPAERLLVYATGGLAFGSIKSHSSYVVTDGARTVDFIGSNSDTRWGWAIGAGAEYAFTNNLSAKLEYLYVDLDSKHYAATTTARGLTGVNYRVKDETSFQVLRAGLNFKFSTY